MSASGNTLLIVAIAALLLVVLAWRDVWRRRPAGFSKEALESQYRLLFENNPLPCWLYDLETLRFLRVNDMMVMHYGYSREELLDMSVMDIRSPEEAERLKQALATSPKSLSGQIWQHRRKDGSLIQVLSRSADIVFDGRPARLVLAEDVTERLNIEQRLAHQARHDALTGLPNRSALVQALGERLATAEGEGAHVGVVYVSFERIGTINASLGHAVGDAVLRGVGERLRGLAQDPGQVARIGGCEFALLITGVEGERPIEPELARLRAAIAEPLQALGTQHELHACFGYACHPRHGTDAESLFNHAALAAHEAKRLGSDQAVEYSPVFEQVMDERLDMIARLRTAIAKGEFELFFQPQFRAADRRPIGVEALIRWRHPERGLVPPALFIAICEDSGLSVPLGRWVLREACRYHRLLLEAGWEGVSVAINVSASQFESGHLLEDMRGLVKEFDLKPGAIELELTERIVMENTDAAIATLRQLRELGLSLAIDDFGTGYSSLSHLRRLPVDKLKIDREFVNNIEHDAHNQTIGGSIIALGHNFGLKVVAEGVETLEQLEWLRQARCDALQGYLLARPMPFAEMLASLGRPPAR